MPIVACALFHWTGQNLMGKPLTLQLKLWGKNSNNYSQFDYYLKKNTDKYTLSQHLHLALVRQTNQMPSNGSSCMCVKYFKQLSSPVTSINLNHLFVHGVNQLIDWHEFCMAFFSASSPSSSSCNFFLTETTHWLCETAHSIVRYWGACAHHHKWIIVIIMSWTQARANTIVKKWMQNGAKNAFKFKFAERGLTKRKPIAWQHFFLFPRFDATNERTENKHDMRMQWFVNCCLVKHNGRLRESKAH